MLRQPRDQAILINHAGVFSNILILVSNVDVVFNDGSRAGYHVTAVELGRCTPVFPPSHLMKYKVMVFSSKNKFNSDK